MANTPTTPDDMGQVRSDEGSIPARNGHIGRIVAGSLATGVVAALRGVEDRVVAAVAPERVQPRARQVHRDDRGVVGVALDLARRVAGVLRAGDDGAQQRVVARGPLVHEPRVVRAREGGGRAGQEREGDQERRARAQATS